MSRARASAWLVCVVMLCATGTVPAQSTRPVPPVAVGQFDKQALERTTGTVAVRNGAATATTRPQAPSTTLGALRVVAALALVIVVILLLRWIAQQVFGMPTARKSSRAVQVLSRSMISPKQQVVLLQVGRRVIVVGDAGGQMSPLAQITDPDEIAALAGQLQEDKSTTPSRSFSSLFGRAQTRFDHDTEPEKPAVDGPEDLDPALATTQAELSGLMQKVRSVAAGMNKPSN